MRACLACSMSSKECTVQIAVEDVGREHTQERYPIDNHIEADHVRCQDANSTQQQQDVEVPLHSHS